MQIHSDQGSNFESAVFREMCKVLGIEKTRTTPMRPQSDGMIERANRTILNMLSSFVSANQTDWDKFLPLVLMAYRSSMHESTGVTPCAMMLGREISLPIDLLYGHPENERETDLTLSSEYAYDLQEKLDQIHTYARKRLNISSKVMKKNYDHRIIHHIYEVGDKVWLYDPHRRVGLNPKLRRPWSGPYVVKRKLNDVLYFIRAGPKSRPKVVHHDRLKPYY